MRRTAPLNALRAFEAAARHQSFAKAAEELFVTPAAISRQVKLLEDHLGMPLFTRHAQGVVLEPEARLYAAGLAKAFFHITAINDEFRTRHTSSTLTVRGYTTFLVKWLVPRLPEFQGHYPKINVRLSSGTSPGAQGDADVLIRYGRGRWPGFVVQRLFYDELVPVCAPALLDANTRKQRVPLSAKQVAELPLLSLEARRQDWPDWLAQCGAAAPGARPRLLEDLAVLLEFARRGLGVALAQSSYVADDIASGTLVKVSSEALRRDLAYFAIATEEQMSRTKVATFMTWLATQSSSPHEPVTGRRRGGKKPQEN